MSLISSWFEEETEQERQTEYRAPSPIIHANSSSVPNDFLK